jgi:uncharacterized protein (TIGR02246 family)
MDRDEKRAIAWECQRILTKFCLFNDRKQSDDLANLFTPDGVWLRLGKSLTGRENISKAMEARPATALHLHLLSNVFVMVTDADQAEVTSYKSIYYDAAGESLDKPIPLNGPKWVSVYTDKFVRTDEGWRIARMEGTTLFEGEPGP